ncbi:TolC family protein [Corticimicrobacter populi]|uniref:Protein CyaE n=1 Tax=Corticimicrobacter populi TaxID=2175229 RepID=A0A2V1JXT4_9BURK|nr:TolC family protein [Corticimicrobacter populi]PWF23292.1 TolC family protein [Corticimicrobacter populi]
MMTIYKLLPVTLLLAGCAGQALDRAPASSDRPWRGSAPDGISQQVSEAPIDGFGVPYIRALSQPASGQAAISLQEGAYDLAQLIDLAQRENPQTRQAWNHAREAALATGLVEATFLPQLSANVLTGHQRTRRPLPTDIAGISDIDTKVQGTVPSLALGWLLFDFGQRAALLEGAEQLSFAANVLFNGIHQKVIRDVTDQYYQYEAARSRTRLAHEALANQKAVEAAAADRLRGGVGTTVELAVARQAVSQAQFHLVNSEGLERNIYLALLGAVGLPPTARIEVAAPPVRFLPGPDSALTQEALDMAIARRPDVVAAYAAAKAAEAGIRAAEAEFLPKVYLGAVASHSRTSFDVRGLPTLSQQATSRGVLLGVSLPLYDGGLRRTQLQRAEIRHESARETLQTLQRDAVREMVAAETMLNSALQGHQAADDLVRTAQTAYDAALAAFESGVGTITLATEMATRLLEARQARADAYSMALVMAANLAFATGAMIHPQEDWLPAADAVR